MPTPAAAPDTGASACVTPSDRGIPAPVLDFSRMEIPDDAVVEILRRLTPAERLVIANRMWVSARKVLLHLLRNENPQWSEQQVQEEVARRMCGAVRTS